MTNIMRDTVIEVLSRRITDEDVDLGEAADAIFDALRLRQDWTWRLPNGDTGPNLDNRSLVLQQTASITPTPTILFRLASDWEVEE